MDTLEERRLDQEVVAWWRWLAGRAGVVTTGGGSYRGAHLPGCVQLKHANRMRLIHVEDLKEYMLADEGWHYGIDFKTGEAYLAKHRLMACSTCLDPPSGTGVLCAECGGPMRDSDHRYPRHAHHRDSLGI